MALRSEYDLFEKLLETKNSIQEQGNGDKDSKIVSSDVIETSQDLESLRKPPTDISTVRVWEPESVESLDYEYAHFRFFWSFLNILNCERHCHHQRRGV